MSSFRIFYNKFIAERQRLFRNLEIAIIVIHLPSRMKPCTLKGSKIKLDRIFLINFFKNTKGQTLPHKNAAHLFGWFIHRVKRKNDFVQQSENVQQHQFETCLGKKENLSWLFFIIIPWSNVQGRSVLMVLIFTSVLIVFFVSCTSSSSSLS